VVSIAPFSTPDCPDCSRACFRFLIFHPFSRGSPDPICPDVRTPVAKLSLLCLRPAFSAFFSILTKRKLLTSKSALSILEDYSKPIGGCLRPCAARTHTQTDGHPENIMHPAQSCPWVGLTHGLGWIEIFQFWWVGSTKAKVLKFERIILMHLKHG